MARLFNVLAEFFKQAGKLVRRLGMGALIRFVRETIGGLWLDKLELRRRLADGKQLRLLSA